MRNSLETKLGIFVVLTIFAAVFIIEVLGSADMFTHGYRVTALFDTAQDLKVGDHVKMAGVEIGRVDKISLADGKVMVTMKLCVKTFKRKWVCHKLVKNQLKKKLS